MDKRLKVGDKVICLDARGFGHRLIEGKEYTITKRTYTDSVGVAEEPTRTYNEERFERVEDCKGWNSP